MKEWSLYACRVIAGIVFIVSAVLKFIDIDSFELYLYGLDLVNLDLCYIGARLLLGAEVSLGLALISNQYRKVINLLTYIILGIFSIFLIVQIIQGNNGNCHCMGEEINLPPIPSLIKNLVLATLVYLSNKGKTFLIKWAHIGLAVLAIAITATIFIVSPPDTLAKDKKEHIHRDHFNKYIKLEKELNKYPAHQKTLVCLFSTTCHICKLSAQKLQLLLDKYQIPSTQVYELFVGTEDELKDFRKETEAKFYTYHILPPDIFWQMTSNVPVFVVMKEGEIEEVFSYRTMNEERIKGLKN